MNRRIAERQEAVRELSSSETPSLSLLKEAVTKLPDLEKMLCSAYHKKVCVCVCACVRACVCAYERERERERERDVCVHTPLYAVFSLGVFLNGVSTGAGTEAAPLLLRDGP